MQFKELDANGLIAAYRAGEASPVEAVKYFINHAAQCEPQLHALYLFEPETALTEARKSESRWRAGQPLGPLDGVPVTIKENIATVGAPMPLGTAASELNPAPADAPPTQRLREAGAIVIAKTTMPDFGMLSSGLSSFHPLTRNPWDLSKTPGGSSSGAAAATAAGYAPINLGTDIGGSIRLPAGWCGVFGFKPSNGRVPIDPPYMGRVAGPITRTVADAVLAMSVLARPDNRDHMAAPFAPADWTLQPPNLRGLRFGLLMDAGCGLPVDAETAAAVETAAR
jgi:aspartyl-tRNA(Asn)/glutamyl-tRNA(Gln) amidotransferase subunit A